jgi:autophagy-related protein 13
VLAETKKALQISQSDSITNRLPLCVEISLQTVDGDKMILEVWSLNINTDLSDPSIKATYTIYNRMSILLKSLISITRVTPAYKLSRRQSPDSYSIYYRIYSGEPQHNLGECDGKSMHNFACLKSDEAATKHCMRLLHVHLMLRP